MIIKAFTIWHIGSDFESAAQELAQGIEFTNEYRLGTYTENDMNALKDAINDHDIDALFIETHYIDEDRINDDTTDLYDAFYLGSDYDTAEEFLTKLKEA